MNIKKNHRAHQNLQLVQTIATVSSITFLQLPERLTQWLLSESDWNALLKPCLMISLDSASTFLLLRKGKKSNVMQHFTKRNWMKEYAYFKYLCWSLESFKGSKPIFCQEETCQILNTLKSKRKNKIEPEQFNLHSWNANLSYIQVFSTASQTLSKNLGS